ncbi:MAG: hypothetical protein DHS20C08_20960 [Rhodomicrobium sp.]|nr:MAG: hypothetical protein DHS20C08_20960 [Rhodomicrobium sp.]
MPIRVLIIWLLSLAFFSFGLYKISGYDIPLEAFFTSIGIPAWLTYIIGAAEIAGAASLIFGRIIHPLLPRLAMLGLLLLVLSAITLHVIYDPLIKALPASILFGLLIYSLWTAPNQSSQTI